MTAFYNEIDEYAAQWLRNLIAAGHIAPGVVDTRSIADLQPADIAGYTQVHFFAGIGGWSLAARLARWPDSRSLWTGSCPCQPFSVAGAGKGQEDARHLWPEMFRLIAAVRPDVVMGEQVAAAVGKSWLDGVCSDLESIGYAYGAAVVPACAVDAPHRRDRLWFVADQSGGGLEVAPLESRIGGTASGIRETNIAGMLGSSSHVADCNGEGSSILFSEPGITRSQQSPALRTSRGAFWSDAEFVAGHDGKARRVKPGIRLLAHGIPARVGKLRAFGNAIVPQVAEQVLRAYMEATAAPVLKSLPPLPY